METTAQHTTDLHSKVGSELKAMGQPPQTVPAHEQPVLDEGLRDVVGDLGYTVSSGVEQVFSGKGPDTDVRVTPSKRLVRWVLNRARKK